ncbi:MAG: hypothetical protein ACK4VJ_05940 [Rhodoluna sp.]
MSLLKFAGLIRSGISMQQALAMIGGAPTDKNIQFLIAVALETGSAAATEISLIADQIAELEKSRQRIEILRAAPRASVRLIIWFPVVVFALAELSGFGLIESIIRQPVLLASVGIGFCLLIIAKFSTGRFVRAVGPEQSSTGLFLLGVAMNLGAGGSIENSRTLATGMFQKVYGISPEETEIAAFREIAELSEQTGNPAGELFRRQADILQRLEQLEIGKRIEKLSIRLLLPLGLLVLPAFILMALVPLSFSMLGFE